jgi:hypothetical protein
MQRINSHESLIIGCNLLNVNVTLGFDEGFWSTEGSTASDDGDDILIFSRRLHSDLPLTTMGMTYFDDTGKLGRICKLFVADMYKMEGTRYVRT